jgi:hypothetical protein
MLWLLKMRINSRRVVYILLHNQLLNRPLLYCHVTKWWVLVRTLGFISSLVTHAFNYTQIHRQYSAIADLHTFPFTAAHALEFSVSTSSLLATDLYTETVTSNRYKYYTRNLPATLYILTGRPPVFFCSPGSTSLASATSSTVDLFGASGIHLETANN